MIKDLSNKRCSAILSKSVLRVTAEGSIESVHIKHLFWLHKLLHKQNHIRLIG